MKRMWNSNLPNLGVGFGYRDVYRTDVFRHESEIDFLEVTADHFFDPKPRTVELLRLLAERFPIIPHGLALSLGSAEGLDRSYLAKLKQLVLKLDPPWWSEHIAFTRAGGIDIGHLTPLPKTRETLRVLRENIRIAVDSIEKPLILENITQTISFPQDTLDEASFLGELVDENDCGLLLDVTNLYINSINYRFDPLAILHRLPKNRIVQLHFVGYYDDDKTLIDSHAHSTNPEIWQLLVEVVQFANVQGAILERDEHFPPFTELLLELSQMRKMMLSREGI
jgi:uncharacterized protein (UPF0276 family)